MKVLAEHMRYPRGASTEYLEGVARAWDRLMHHVEGLEVVRAHYAELMTRTGTAEQEARASAEAARRANATRDWAEAELIAVRGQLDMQNLIRRGVEAIERIAAALEKRG